MRLGSGRVGSWHHVLINSLAMADISGKGVLSMSNRGAPDTNNSAFFITLSKQHRLDGLPGGRPAGAVVCEKAGCVSERRRSHVDMLGVPRALGSVCSTARQPGFQWGLFGREARGIRKGHGRL